MALRPMTLYVLRPGLRATLRSVDGARVMLCGGEAFATPRHVWWNFVSSSKDRIMAARDDWKAGRFARIPGDADEYRSEEHTSELQSLMRISYAVFCLKKKKHT